MLRQFPRIQFSLSRADVQAVWIRRTRRVYATKHLKSYNSVSFDSVVSGLECLETHESAMYPRLYVEDWSPPSLMNSSPTTQIETRPSRSYFSNELSHKTLAHTRPSYLVSCSVFPLSLFLAVHLPCTEASVTSHPRSHT